MVDTPQPKRKKLLKKLKSRFRLTLLNERTFEETFSYSLTPLNLIISFGGLLLVFGMLIYLLVAFTPLKNYVIPDYTDAAMREEARLARVKADSLMEVVRKNERYLNDLKIVLSGGTLSNTADTSEHKQVQAADLNHQVSPVENQLRQKIAEQDRYHLSVEEENSSAKKSLLLFRPVNGTVSSKFSPKDGHYGIDLIAPKEDPVKAVLDGTVILSSFTANDGNVIQIQHANNLISVYKHNSALLKKSGDYVKAGESIAFIGNSGDHSEGPHLHFELWEGGVPVNPLDYLSLGK
jgi:murein DD-endopeptidase MepM/ murein hydrolase activator NlpD